MEKRLRCSVRTLMERGTRGRWDCYHNQSINQSIKRCYQLAYVKSELYMHNDEQDALNESWCQEMLHVKHYMYLLTSTLIQGILFIIVHV